MSRVTIDLPADFHFETQLDVHISYINYGGHLANDAILSLAHEARMRFIASLGQEELKFYGKGLIMADCAIVFKNEAFHGQKLQIKIAIANLSRVAFDLIYLLENEGIEIARVKTAMIYFDYDSHKVASLPDEFKSQFIQGD